MHSSVIEVCRASVPKSAWIRAGHLPDWFYEQACGCGENLGPIRREKVIEQFCASFGELCARSGDMLTISPQIRETYFRKSYDCFKAAVEELARTSYDAFSGICGFPVFSRVLDALNESVENKRSTYIYLSELDELLTLNRWIRTADLSKPFYVGGTISYHN